MSYDFNKANAHLLHVSTCEGAATGLVDPGAHLDCVDRKYWCFLLSSIVTFVMCMMFVILWRAITFCCCQPNDLDDLPADDSGPSKNPKLDQRNFDDYGGPPPPQQDEVEIGWMTEAKDWAGELISGQSTTGRILVSDLTDLSD